MSGSTPQDATDSAASAPSELDALWKEFITHVDRLRVAYFRENRSRSQNVYEVMNATERAEVHQIMAGWDRYITPLAEAWWKERGYGVKWPTDNSQPMEIYKLETA